MHGGSNALSTACWRDASLILQCEEVISTLEFAILKHKLVSTVHLTRHRHVSSHIKALIMICFSHSALINQTSLCMRGCGASNCARMATKPC